MRLGLRRLLTTMSAMENKGPSMLASPKTQDPLFRRIEDVHEDLRKPYGRVLDAGPVRCDTTRRISKTAFTG